MGNDPTHCRSELVQIVGFGIYFHDCFSTLSSKFIVHRPEFLCYAAIYRKAGLCI